MLLGLGLRFEHAALLGDVLLRECLALVVDLDLALFEAVAAEGLWLGAEAPIDRARVRSRAEGCLSARDAVLLLAFDGPEIVGAISLRSDDGIVSFGMLVGAGHRGRGVGRNLLDAGIAWAVERIGAHKVMLEVWPHNDAAITLYRQVLRLDPGNADQPMPVVLTGPKAAANYFKQVDAFIGLTLGPAAQARCRARRTCFQLFTNGLWLSPWALRAWCTPRLAGDAAQRGLLCGGWMPLALAGWPRPSRS